MPIMGAPTLSSSPKSYQIILDGQQRITSLLYAIKPTGFKLKGSESPSYFYINFQTHFGWPGSNGNARTSKTSGELIEVYSSQLSRDETIRKMLFPFYELQNYADWVEGLEDQMYNYEGADRRKIVEIRRVVEKRLRHLWEEYEIPYILLRYTVKLDQVT